MKFETESGSLYEVDEEANKVRRLIGVKDPTPRQGKDGEWKSYMEHTPVVVGKGVVFLWATAGIVGRSTITSLVKRVLDDDQSN